MITRDRLLKSYREIQRLKDKGRKDTKVCCLKDLELIVQEILDSLKGAKNFNLGRIYITIKVRRVNVRHERVS